jgi:hypothetical protein
MDWLVNGDGLTDANRPGEKRKRSIETNAKVDFGNLQICHDRAIVMA